MRSATTCKSCRSPLPGDARFCPNCGTSAGTVCGACGKSSRIDAAHCDQCGTALGGHADEGTQADPWDVPGGAVARGATASIHAPVPAVRADYAGPAVAWPVDRTACPRCGALNQSHATFCATCGLPYDVPRVSGLPRAVDAVGVPAGFWIRFIPFFLDYGLVLLLGTVLWPVLFDQSFWANAGGSVPGQTSLSFAASDWGAFFINFAYQTALLRLFGTTPGKRLFGIYVVGADGRKISWGRAAARSLVTYVSGLLLLGGYIMVAFRRDKRALHDLAAGTFAITRRR